MRPTALLPGAVNTLVRAGDHQSRVRVSLAYEFNALDAGFADALDWQVYRQDSETTQDTLEERITAAGLPERRERSFNFDQRAHGLQANFYKTFATGSAHHDLTWGIDASRTETRQKRDGVAEARIHGAELKAGVDLGALSAAWEGVVAARRRGMVTRRGPYKDRVSDPDLYRTPGYGVLDRFTAAGRSVAVSLSVEF